MNYLITIIGPTAIGKTSLSIALAKHFNCSIISCDSRQFFKEMRIGTAVPSEMELASAPHYFIQNKSIFDSYTVGDFEKEAIAKLDELFAENHVQILVGGSGLYVDALLESIDDFPEIDKSIREKITIDFEVFGIDYLQKQFKILDPDFYHQIETENPQTLQNPQRMKRFIEVSLGTGKPYSSFLNKKTVVRNFTPIIIGLEAPRETIYERINKRVDLMIDEGLINEAESLSAFKDLNALQTVGYRELFEYFDGTVSLDFAIEEIKKNTRRFSKRQLTWFKRTENVKWFDYMESKSDIIDYITQKINE